MPSLIYTGQGYRPDLPARDIDAVELAAIAKEQNTSVPQLVERARSSGLYQIIAEPDDEAVGLGEKPVNHGVEALGPEVHGPPSPLGDTVGALQAALGELQLPADPEDGEGFFTHGRIPSKGRDESR